jgi:ubiquinone/menaquinone biosynthesis C-methylase UbiE
MSKEYFNSKAAVWDELIAERDPEKLQSLADLLDITAGEAVLDVGTGTGVFVPFILKKIGKKGRLFCLDYAEDMLEKARSKGFQGNINYLCEDVCDTILGDNVFHVAVCYSSFPHFIDKPRALKEIHRLLKPGGKIFICHSSSRDAINTLHSNLPEVHQDLIPDKNEMEQLLADAGFTDVYNMDAADKYFVRALKKRPHI